MEIIGYPTTLTSSYQFSHHFSTFSSNNNDTLYLQPVIETLRVRQNIFANYAEELDTKVMPPSYVAPTPSHLVLEEILTGSTNFMVINQMRHQ